MTGTDHCPSAHETHSLGVQVASLEVERVEGPTWLGPLIKESSPDL